MLIKPHQLLEGDTIGILSPSFNAIIPIRINAEIDSGKHLLSFKECLVDQAYKEI